MNTVQSGTRKYKLRPGPGRAVLQELPADEILHLPGGGKLYLPNMGSQPAINCKVVVEAEPYEDDLGRPMKARYPVGSHVIVTKFTGTVLTIDRQEFRIVRESDIITEIILDEAPSGEAQQGT